MAAAALVDAPNIDWTEDDGLYRRVELFSRDMEDMMLGPLVTHNKPSKTRTLMHWLPESMKELVWEARKDTENDYRKVTAFLLDWAKPKTTVYKKFKKIRITHAGSWMVCKQYIILNHMFSEKAASFPKPFPAAFLTLDSGKIHSIWVSIHLHLYF